MSEEEIIESVKYHILLEYNGFCNIDKVSLQGILDLYQKEKEENIKLTNTIKYLKEEKERNKELLNEKESVFDKGYFEGTKDGEETIRDEIRFYYKKICASVNHFQSKNDNNIVLRIKEYLEELLEENKSNENNI